MFKSSGFLFLFFFVLIDCKCQETFYHTLVIICTVNNDCTKYYVTKCLSPGYTSKGTVSIEVLSNLYELEKGAFQDFRELSSIVIYPIGFRSLQPGVFQNVISLRNVSVMNNQLKEIYFGVFSDSFIRIVNLESNWIDLIEDGSFRNMPKLKTLKLSQNRLTILKSSWFSEKTTNTIEELMLSNNLIGHVESLNNCPNLRVLDLSFNWIKTIQSEAFVELKQLTSLNLFRNELKLLDANLFDKNNSLRNLYVGKNNLRSLPGDLLVKMDRLSNISFIPNPWQCACYFAVSNWVYQKKITVIPMPIEPNTDWLPFCSVCAGEGRSGDCVAETEKEINLAIERFTKKLSEVSDQWWLQHKKEKSTASPHYNNCIQKIQSIINNFSNMMRQ